MMNEDFKEPIEFMTPMQLRTIKKRGKLARKLETKGYRNIYELRQDGINKLNQLLTRTLNELKKERYTSPQKQKEGEGPVFDDEKVQVLVDSTKALMPIVSPGIEKEIDLSVSNVVENIRFYKKNKENDFMQKYKQIMRREYQTVVNSSNTTPTINEEQKENMMTLVEETFEDEPYEKNNLLHQILHKTIFHGVKENENPFRTIDTNDFNLLADTVFEKVSESNPKYAKFLRDEWLQTAIESFQVSGEELFTVFNVIEEASKSGIDPKEIFFEQNKQIEEPQQQQIEGKKQEEQPLPKVEELENQKQKQNIDVEAKTGGKGFVSPIGNRQTQINKIRSKGIEIPSLVSSDKTDFGREEGKFVAGLRTQPERKIEPRFGEKKINADTGKLNLNFIPMPEEQKQILSSTGIFRTQRPASLEEQFNVPPTNTTRKEPLKSPDDITEEEKELQKFDEFLEEIRKADEQQVAEKFRSKFEKEVEEVFRRTQERNASKRITENAIESAKESEASRAEENQQQTMSSTSEILQAAREVFEIEGDREVSDTDLLKVLGTL
jgi:hypothetical protein